MRDSTFKTAPRRKSILAGLAGVGVAVALVGGLTTALHARVALTDDAPINVKQERIRIEIFVRDNLP